MATTYTLYMPNPLPVGTLLRFTETVTNRVALCEVVSQGYATEVIVVLGELPNQRFEGRVEIVGE